ncbi:GTP cyclohydrolase, FolE2/MptA family [Thermodesulfobacteriota bacterium]
MSSFIPEEKHRMVLETGIDVPEEIPSFSIPIQKVGISGKTVWVCLTENNGGHLPFTARIQVNLPATRRGIHMSRIEQVITTLHNKQFASLPEYGKLLASNVLEAQNAQNVSLELTGRTPHIRKTSISRLASIDSYEVSCTVKLAKNEHKTMENIQVSAGVHHLTACPCTLSYNEVLFNRFDDPYPQATHSQRSKTELSVSTNDSKQLPAYEVLLNILHEVLHVSQDLLKRPDETELVLKAHRQPQFAEDTVREIARAAGKKLKETLPPETKIQIKTLSLESIHIHDVECCLETQLGEILATSSAYIEDQKK